MNYSFKLFLNAILIFLSSTIIAQHQIGHYNITFQDPDRSNRNIETEIYYPATTAGNNTPAASGQFPVIVFGHGFVMAWDAYQNLWEEFVPNGYIMVFPRTEGNLLSTDHQQFGWDLQFLVTKMQDEGNNNTSPIYNAVSNNTALMGHSMGGGASFLAADSLCVNGNSQLKTIIGLAPAESSSNGVSSISSATNITIPSVILSGSQDGVTPPFDHHIPMYDNLSSDCKTFISISGGGHCYFANSNFNCDFGEGTSSTGISISRTEQHAVTFDFLNLWLDYSLKDDCGDFSVFQDSLAISNRVTSNQSCNIPFTSSYSSITACNSYLWNGTTYTSSGLYTNTTTNINCSIHVDTLDLSISNSGTSSNVTACDNYSWNGNSYTQSGTYTFISGSCADTLYLNINNSNTASDIQTACEPYMWIDGNTYTSSNNTSTHTLINTAGCDSVVTLDLTINTVNNGITNSSPTLSANATGAVYQWLDCDNNFTIIPGETNQDFTATTSGNYAVKISQNNCTDTSNCELISVIGVIENSFKFSPHIFPNPTSGQLNLELDNIQEQITINISSITGRLVSTKKYTSTKKIYFEIIEARGVYMVEIISQDGNHAKLKVIKY